VEAVTQTSGTAGLSARISPILYFLIVSAMLLFCNNTTVPLLLSRMRNTQPYSSICKHNQKHS